MKVLIALDDSTHSEYLVKTVVSRKWPQDTQFKIVTVVEPIDIEFEEQSWMTLADEVHRRRRSHAEALCDRARHEIEKHVATSSVHFEVREGDACCRLIDAAVDWSADKILVGAHANPACPHMSLGSVSRALSIHSPCSVEVIREKQKLVAV